MIIGGFQKMTLLDFPGRVAAMVFTRGCNFRCPYCHNPELLDKSRGADYSTEQILRYLSAKRFFLDGVVITGGEPTIHPGLPDFLREVKALGLLVKLDTNGSNPMVLKTLLKQGLVDYVAMDVKAGWGNYEKITKLPGIEGNCIRSMGLIRESGVDYEFRTTVFPPVNDTADMAAIRREIKAGERYYTNDLRIGNCLDERLNAPARETVELKIPTSLETRARKTVELDIAS